MNKLKGHTYLSESAARANSKFSGGFKGIISAVEQCLSTLRRFDIEDLCSGKPLIILNDGNKVYWYFVGQLFRKKQFIIIILI